MKLEISISSFKYFRTIRIEKQIRPFVFGRSFFRQFCFWDLLTFSFDTFGVLYFLMVRSWSWGKRASHWQLIQTKLSKRAPKSLHWLKRDNKIYLRKNYQYQYVLKKYFNIMTWQDTMLAWSFFYISVSILILLYIPGINTFCMDFASVIKFGGDSSAKQATSP